MAQKAGAGFPGARGRRPWAGAGRDRDQVLGPWAEFLIPLGWQPGTDTKLAPVALPRSCTPASPQSKCHPLCEGKGEREDGRRERRRGGNGPISTGDKKEHDKQGPLGSFCHVLPVAKK